MEKLAKQEILGMQFTPLHTAIAEHLKNKMSCAFCERFQRIVNYDFNLTIDEKHVTCHNCRMVWEQDSDGKWHAIGVKELEFKD